MISKEIEDCFNYAVEEANKRGHEFLTIEHILYSLLKDAKIRMVVEECNGDVDLLRNDLVNFFETKLEVIEDQNKKKAKPTIAFQRLLQKAAECVLSCEKETIYNESLLIAIFSERNSFARFFLEKQSVTRYEVLKCISHGLEQKIDDSKLLIQKQTSQDKSFTIPDKSHTTEKEQKSSRNKNNFLDLYTENVCDKAKKKLLDPLIGRKVELDRIIQVLCRRRKNTPLLVGESGVGKTAIAEGLASLIVEEQVPERLKKAQMYRLDLGLLLAGAKFRGDFENRLKGLIKELNAQPYSILFIDEIHTIIGAGAVSGGSLDASNLLKPLLGTGKIACIGSTTFKEYRQHFESDYTMARRFQVIKVKEPSVKESVKILQGVKKYYEAFHQVTYSDDAIKGSVEIASRYIKDRKLPDSAMDVLDEAGAYKALKKEKKDKKDKKVLIKTHDVKKMVAELMNIPIDRMNTSDQKNLKAIGTRLKDLIFGQDDAVDYLENVIRLSYSGLSEEIKPIGSFLFSGPTGVGKTELAKQLANILKIEFVRFDMSEYMEKHTVSRLIGAPPGYVGYNEGGLLTDAIHKNPHCLLLLDEMEKAHPDLHNILLQVMDHGTLTDSNGRETDFRNVILVLTTNVGAKELTQKSIGFGDIRANKGSELKAIKEAFSPEFRNRLNGILSFSYLRKESVIKIVHKFIAELTEQLQKKNIKLTTADAAVLYLADKGYDPDYGARPLARLIQDVIKKPLSEEILFGKLTKGGSVNIDMIDDHISLSYPSN